MVHHPAGRSRPRPDGGGAPPSSSQTASRFRRRPWAKSSRRRQTGWDSCIYPLYSSGGTSRCRGSARSRRRRGGSLERARGRTWGRSRGGAVGSGCARGGAGERGCARGGARGSGSGSGGRRGLQWSPSSSMAPPIRSGVIADESSCIFIPFYLSRHKVYVIDSDTDRSLQACRDCLVDSRGRSSQGRTAPLPSSPLAWALMPPAPTTSSPSRSFEQPDCSPGGFPGVGGGEQRAVPAPALVVAGSTRYRWWLARRSCHGARLRVAHRLLFNLLRLRVRIPENAGGEVRFP